MFELLRRAQQLNGDTRLWIIIVIILIMSIGSALFGLPW